MFNKKVLLLLILCSSKALAAEQIILKNGDRISGFIVNLADKKLAIKTDYAGTVTVDWGAVTQLSSDQPVVITRSDKTVVSGTLTARDTTVIVHTNPGEHEVPLSDIVGVRSPTEQAAYEKSLHPGMLEGWAGGGNLGLALAKGNSDTTNLAFGFNAARPTPTDKLSLTAAALYARNTTNGIRTTSANSFAASLRYDRNLMERLFAFGLMAGSYDHAQSLNERLNPSAGLGFHAIASKATTLDLLGGLGYTYENYSTGLRNNLINLTLGEEATHKFSANTSLVQDLYFFPDLNRSGEYRANFDFGIATKLHGALTWNVNLADRYVSNPVAGKKNNDVLLTTGLGLTFGAMRK